MPVIGPNASQLRAGVQAAIQVADEEEFERQLASSTVRSHEKAEEQLRAFGEQSVAEQRRKGDLSIPADLDQYLRSDTPFPDQFWSALTHWACKRFDGDIGRTSTTITIVFYGFYCRSKPEARVGSRIREAVKSIVMHHPSVRPPDEKKYVASSDYEQILGFGASRQMKVCPQTGADGDSLWPSRCYGLQSRRARRVRRLWTRQCTPLARLPVRSPRAGTPGRPQPSRCQRDVAQHQALSQ